MRPYYYATDAVRFVSALIVVLFHLGFYCWACPASTLYVPFGHVATFAPLAPFTWFGFVGVQIFFVISGFVIANSASNATALEFLRSRLLRLLPAAWVCATVTLLVVVLAHRQINVLLIEDYLRSVSLWVTGAWIDGSYWTLAIEIIFYAMVFLLLLFHGFRYVNVLALGLAAASTVFLAVEVLHDYHLAARGIWFDVLDSLANTLPIRHGVYFALGIWMWMAANGRADRWIRVAIALAIAVGSVQIMWRALQVETVETLNVVSAPVIVPALAWLVAVLVIAIDALMPGRLMPRTEAGQGFMKMLGRLTYPLYLVHAVVGVTVMHALIVRGVPPYLALGMTVAGLVSLAWLVALWAEPQLRQRLKSWLDALGHIGGRHGGRPA